MAFKCIQLALSDFYKSHANYKTRINLHARLYPKDSAVGAASAALYLLKYSKVIAIIGPRISVEAEFVIQLGEKARVPILSYSPTIHLLPTRQSSYFIHAAQKDSLQVKAISALMQAFQWREVTPIYEDSDYGSGLMPFLDDALQQIGAHIPSPEPIQLSATDNQLVQLLRKLKAKQTRVFLVHMSLELASRLFLIVDELNMMDEGYAWISTTSIGNELDSLNHSIIEAMHGVIGLKTYVPETNVLKQFRNRWDQELKGVKLNVMGLWAYDAACALARAVEDVVAPNSAFRRTKMDGKVTDLDTLGLSAVGSELLQALRNTSFTGLAGNFSLVNGKLTRSSTFKVVNVRDGGAREIGFWTPENGLTRKLYTRSNQPASSANLRQVIWPGEPKSAPKGWEIPADGNKLRVGVPVKHVYQKLVNVSQLRSSDTPKSSKVTGFCIDIFDAVMEKLGYAGDYEYYPFALPNGTAAGTYDELVHQVFLQKYDIVVGDITIIANRTQFVDFTLPYTESGVTMVVPVKNNKQSAWVFLKPLSWELWVTILSTFIFIAVVIWIFEHRINIEFRGPPLHQVGTSLFYSFSMMVFAQRENVVSNLTRLVVIVWVFMVLILTQSYTASLTSLLTVQQLQPSVTSVDELLRTGAYVGFQEGSFVHELLRRKGFDKTKIVSYNTTDKLDSLLSAGTSSCTDTNGSIAAVFDEIPYMKLFLASYPSKYIMVPPIYNADGFGFALPKGSPLVPEISREMLKIIEGDRMLSFEKKWGMQMYNSSEQGNQVTSSSVIGLDSVWGLFVIVAVASATSLVIYFAEFLCDHRHIWMYSDDKSVWSRIRSLTEAFVERDMAAHTFRNKEAAQSVRNTEEAEQARVEADVACEIQNTSTPPRLSNHSDQTEDNFGMPSAATLAPECDNHYPTVQ